MTTGAAVLLAAIWLSLTSCASAKLVTSDQAACSAATARGTAERRLPADHVAVCDHVHSTETPVGYYVLALRAYCRQEEGCGSTNMGWFAVQGSTGAVFEWDAAEGKLGRRLDQPGAPLSPG